MKKIWTYDSSLASLTTDEVLDLALPIGEADDDSFSEEHRTLCEAYQEYMSACGYDYGFPWDIHDDIPSARYLAIGVLDSEALCQKFIEANYEFLFKHCPDWILDIDVDTVDNDDRYFAKIASLIVMSTTWIHIDIELVEPKGLNLYKKRFGNIFPELYVRPPPKTLAYRIVDTSDGKRGDIEGVCSGDQ
jgi:hypothetical protein